VQHVPSGAIAWPAPVRRYLPQLIDLVFAAKIKPGKVFDLVLPLEQVAEGYRAMDQRRRSRRCCDRKPWDAASDHSPKRRMTNAADGR
jgi:hypothetical protein